VPKRGLGVDVLTAARARIARCFDDFERVYVSFSGGKDSTVLLHLAAAEARDRGRPLGVLFIDLEGQYRLTIEHIHTCLDLYADIVDTHWVALPIHLRNAVSQYETHWVCWEPGREADWIRQPPPTAVTDQAHYPFYTYAMEFEEFVPEFARWYAAGQSCCCMVGIRTDESLNRWRTIAGNKSTHEGLQWTTWMGGGMVYNAYPIYDWRVEDLWAYHARTGLPYNALYDRMHLAGLTLSQMRICQPYGDDQRRGLWLFHLIEPETWARVVARVNGANAGAMYARQSGNITGMRQITCPEGHTWESFAHLLLESMPERTRTHYENKIAVFLHWWEARGYRGGVIPDEADAADEAAKRVPSWRRICKALLRNDYWCKGLSFTQHRSAAYDKYLKVMKNRRSRWGLI
jgi:predicted phosphoadenosine phosphosulfate sulfurtransferase